MTFDHLRFIEVELQMPLMKLPVRTSLIELERARVLWSPASTLTEAQLRDMGEVTDIIAPNLLHGGGMKAAAAAHPRARLWGPVGIKEKFPELSWHGILGVDAWPYDDELRHVALRGMPDFNESVFLHHRSRVLLVSDLVFNIDESQSRGIGPWLILHLFGTYRRLGVSRLFLKQVKDRAAFQESIERIAALDFSHVAPAHGRVVSEEGKQKLLAALRERGYTA
ncbi:hypothetical protein [Archangium violaceum]|uniref:Uncharacterized protein n=1 Tax=Archangium violaceum Cb vi76 TaxID=1406225 RepID=A0A084STQ9_9BACT|nr:hypothetical protein [Archangium violaceum]KFA91844.1 hypothetical protein Q664_19270 [Archangium violaceum Cb vi76]